MPVEFSILMACYRGTNLAELSSAVDSIVSQMCEEDEFLVIGDGPLTVEVFDFLVGHEKISFHQLPENGGLARALNYGITKCTKEYILRMDDDDISHPSRLELMRQRLILDPVNVLGGYIEEFSPDSNERFIRKVPLDNRSIRHALKYYSPMNHVTVTIQREMLERVGGYPEIAHIEDYGLWQRMMREPDICFANMPQVLVYVKSDAQQALRRKGHSYLRSELHLLGMMYRYRQTDVKNAILFMLTRFCVRLGPKYFLQLARRRLRK